MRKKIFKILLLFLFVFNLTNNSFASEKNISIIMVLWRGMTESEKGFLSKLEDLGYNINYEVYNAKQDRAALANYLRLELLPKINDYDYIYSFGTTATQMVKSLDLKNTAHIFNIVTDPVKSKIVENMHSSGFNISGVSNKVSLKDQIKIAMKIKEIKKLAFFFNPRENNSLIIKKEMQDLALAYGFEVLEYKTPPVGNVLEENLQDLKNKTNNIDFVYIPLDSYLTSRSKEIAEFLLANKLASFAAMQEHVENGVLLGLVPNYYVLGEKAANVLDRHFRGEKLNNIEIQKEDNPKLAINDKTRKELKINIPSSILKKAIKIES